MHIATQPQSTAAAAGAAQFRHLWLELTRKCNLQCVHCYANSGPDLPISDGMTTHDWLVLLRSSRAEGCSSVQFIGGEPLIYPDLPLLLQEASSLNFEEIEVFTIRHTYHAGVGSAILEAQCKDRLVVLLAYKGAP